MLSDLALQIGDGGIGLVENLLSLQNVKLGSDAVLDAEGGELDGILLRLHGLVGDLKLQVELQEGEVVAGNVADESQDDRLPRILG